MSRGFVAGLTLVGVLLGGQVPAGLRGRPADAPGPRRPVALSLADAGRWLFVANQRSGTVSVVDTEARKAMGEVSVGRAPSDLAVTPDGSALVVTDQDAGDLVVLRRRGPRLDAPARVPVGPDPVNVVVSADGSRAFVASRWSRRVTVVDLAAGGPKVRQTIPLPFAPGRQILLPDPVRLVAADAFGGRLAVIDPARGEIESVRELTAHNIRGLAVSEGRLLISHQVLSARATTSRADVHWGNLLTNNLREVALTDVRNLRADLMNDSRLHHLGDAGRGAGDPAGVAVSPGEVVVLALAGVGEVAVGERLDGGWDRLLVGKGPTAVVVGPEGRHAFVVNTFSDSVSVLDLKAKRVVIEIPLGVKADATAADRGEELFHNAQLSHDGWFSCHSCHTHGHTNGLLADTMGDGSYGTPKRVPTLRGVEDTGPFGWTGTAKDLGTQLRSSVETTMRGSKLTAVQQADLLAYLRTLPPAPAFNRFTEKPPAEAARRGAAVFRAQGCAGCHEPPTYSSAKNYDVDLTDERGNRSFNPPSLRGVSQTGPYFHDGRARTLEEVFTKHRHGWKTEPGRADLDDLLSFLADL